MLSTLPFIDEHSIDTDLPPAQVWISLLHAIRRRRHAGPRVAAVLGCQPRTPTERFDGNPGEAIPGFSVVEAEREKFLALGGSHRFAEYSLTFILEQNHLRARTHARFHGVGGRIYRILVIGSGGHGIVVRRLLREIASGAPRERVR